MFIIVIRSTAPIVFHLPSLVAMPTVSVLCCAAGTLSPAATGSSHWSSLDSEDVSAWIHAGREGSDAASPSPSMAQVRCMLWALSHTALCACIGLFKGLG